MQTTRPIQLLFELSKPGCRSVQLPPADVPVRPVAELLPAEALAAAPPPLPELPEPELVRHFVNLSTLNMSVDTHFYPLGSCTMKYNPKRNERLAGLPGMIALHPYQPETTLQGMLELLYRSQQMLAEIAGLDGRIAAAGGRGPRRVDGPAGGGGLFPRPGPEAVRGADPRRRPRHQSGQRHHGRLRTVPVKSTAEGFVDLDDLAAQLDDQTGRAS